MDLGNLRREYNQKGLHRKDLDEDPFRQFDLWFKGAMDAGLQDPSAMGLATCGDDGQPSLRTVLLKEYDESKFVFYTNLDSNKARDIQENQRVALLFTWLELDRQIHIEGTASKIDQQIAEQYFHERPRESQLAAWASNQSHSLPSRETLEKNFQSMEERFAGEDIPLPPFWGGYYVKPSRIEFWQGRENRLHDRFQYLRQQNNQWEIVRLAP